MFENRSLYLEDLRLKAEKKNMLEKEHEGKKK